MYIENAFSPRRCERRCRGRRVTFHDPYLARIRVLRPGYLHLRGPDRFGRVSAIPQAIISCKQHECHGNLAGHFGSPGARGKAHTLSDPAEGSPALLLFTREFYEMLRKRLVPGGCMALQGEGVGPQGNDQVANAIA
jgi:hypothetical protein